MLTDLLKIKPSEKHPTLILFTMFFTIVFATIIGSAIRDAVFLVQFDKNLLPIMYLFIAIVMVFTISIYNKFSKERDQLNLLIVTGIFFSLSLLLFQSFSNTWLIPIFYIWIEVITIFSVMQFWLVAGEIFNPRQAKRTFPLIIAGGSIAAIFSGYGINPFVTYFGSSNLLYLIICSLLVNVFLARILKPYKFNKEKLSTKNNTELNFNNIKNDSYLFSIGIMVAISAILSRIIDYQFKIISASTFPNQDELVNFFGTYYGATGLATLLMQLVITGFILKRFGILIGLLILPISIGIGAMGFLLSGTLLTVFIAKFSDQVFKFSINNSIKEILWLPISVKKKLQSKPVIDGIVRSGVEGLAGIFIFLLVSFNILPESNIHLLSIIVLIGIIFWIWNCFKMTNGYVTSIVGSIENRQLNLDDINFDIDNINTVKTLDKSLLDDSELKQLFAIDLLWELPLAPWKNTLEFLFTNGTLSVQRGILELTWDNPKIISDQLIINKIKNENQLSPYALICANDRGLKKGLSQIKNYLDHNNTTLKIAYAITTLSNDETHQLSLKIINQIHASQIEKDQLHLIGFLKRYPQIFTDNAILNYISNDSDHIKNSILDFLISNPNKLYFDHLIKLLDKPSTKKNAQIALLAIDKNWAFEKLLQILSNPETIARRYKSILSIIHHYNDKRLIDSILTMIDSPHLSIINESSNALIKISKTKSLDDYQLKQVEKSILIIAKRAFQLHLFKSTIINDLNSSLIKDHIEYDLAKITPVLLKLGTLKDPNIPIEKYIHFIDANNTELLPLVLELVETTFSAQAKKYTIPLIDPDTQPVKIAIGLFKESFLTKDNMLLFWMNSNHIWKKTIALNYCMKNEKTRLLQKVEWKIKNDIKKYYNFLNASEKVYLNRNFLNNKIPIEENNAMYSILEKTLLLKSVNLFQKIPGNVLSKIAQIASEVHLEPNEIIFKEGESGDSLFVIITGKVDIINDNKLIANLEQGNCIGEMSILDHAPRSADAITIEETILLQIDQEGFFELMAGNPDIMKEIVKILTKRLRKMNKKLTDSLK